MLRRSARAELDDPPAEIELNQIYDTARELTRAMDEIVWAVNQNTTPGQPGEYLGSSPRTFCHDRRPLPVGHAPELPEWRLTTEVRQTCFCLQGSPEQCRQARRRHRSPCLPRLEAEAFELSVEDNGCGLKPEEPRINRPFRIRQRA